MRHKPGYRHLFSIGLSLKFAKNYYAGLEFLIISPLKIKQKLLAEAYRRLMSLSEYQNTSYLNGILRR
jgi:hypothetical protein